MPPRVSTREPLESIIREIAHSLNTPLAQIEATVLALKVHSEEQKRAIGGLLDATQICKSFLAAFREAAVSVEGCGSVGACSLSDSLKAAAKVYGTRVRKEFQLQVDMPDRLPEYDNNYVLAILLPILENAIEAVTQNGKVMMVGLPQKEANVISISNDTVIKTLPDTMRVIQRVGTLREIYPARRHGAIKRWPVRERIELPHLIHRTGHHVHHTTGFDREEIIDLCIRINSVQPGPGSPNWPPCLGLFKSVVAALTYMRHNRTQAEIGESLGVSQPTISRAISATTPLIPEATREFVPTADDLDPDAQYILDGTLLPCWSWDGHKELYSGKHKTTGMNVQVACTIYGKLAWISDPVHGSRHDNYCREESGVLLTMNPKNWIGDKGYIGNNMITPFRKPAGSALLDWQREYNSEVNKIRWMIEQVISHFKNWTIMHTDYRRPLKTFETTISAVVGLHFYRTA